MFQVYHINSIAIKDSLNDNQQFMYAKLEHATTISFKHDSISIYQVSHH